MIEKVTVSESQSNYGSNAYEFKMDREYNFREILDYILTESDWGSVYLVKPDCKNMSKAAQYSYGSYKVAEYHKGKYTEEPPWEFHPKIVKSFFAIGSWGADDYVIVLRERQNKKF